MEPEPRFGATVVFWKTRGQLGQAQLVLSTVCPASPKGLFPAFTFLLCIEVLFYKMHLKHEFFPCVKVGNSHIKMERPHDSVLILSPSHGIPRAFSFKLDLN